MGNRCIRPVEKHSGESCKSVDWNDEDSIHSMSARNSRHNSGLGKKKSIVSTSTDNSADSLQKSRLGGSIRKQSNGHVRQQLSNISFADEIHQIYFFERDSEHSDGDAESPAIQTRQLQPLQKKLNSSQFSKPRIVKARSTIQIAS
jgi:hypothetical protein